MAEILMHDARCAECDKPLPKLSIAEVIQPDFIVCIECNASAEADWQLMQETIAENKEEFGTCGGHQ